MNPELNGRSPKTGTKTESTKLLQRQILDLYATKPNFVWIAEHLGYSDTYIKKLYRKALREIIIENVEKIRRLETHRLDQMYNKVMDVLQRFHPIINSGEVIRDVVDDENGNPVLDDNGDPVTVRLQDTGPVLAAIDRLLKIQERRARLLGLDKPTKIAATDPTGENGSQVVQFYLPSNGRDANVEEARED